VKASCGNVIRTVALALNLLIVGGALFGSTGPADSADKVIVNKAKRELLCWQTSASSTAEARDVRPAHH
jgi:hypothetical protein